MRKPRSSERGFFHFGSERREERVEIAAPQCFPSVRRRAGFAAERAKPPTFRFGTLARDDVALLTGGPLHIELWPKGGGCSPRS